ncbi:MAG: hypothetical protein QXH87_05760, partial [Candidatus Bathyarchaeia archaeon]
MINVEVDYSGLATSKEELKEKLRNLNRPLSIEELTQILDTTIKNDTSNKVITFLGMLLTYTNSEQINIGFLAESSTGKSYLPLEVSWYFPAEDVIKLGYVSPTAFFHEQGQVEVEETEGYKRVKIHVNLRQKILVFLDMPHSGLLERLRPLLSHDERTIEVRITDRKEKRGLLTKRVIIQGFPTVIFCSANETMSEQEKTRLLLLSPEKTQEKLLSALIIKLEREGDKEAFNKFMESEPSRVFLKQRVEIIKSAHINDIIIPKPLREAILKRFLAKRPYLQPRHTRDVSRLLALIKAHALLNYMHRSREDDNITVNMEDVEAGFSLYEQICEPNEIGISPELYEIYKAWENNGFEGFNITEFQKFYFKTFHKPVGYERARRILKNLAAAGLLTEGPDETDRRQIRFSLLRF